MKITHSTKAGRTEDVVRKWHLIDIRGKVLGRVVSNVTSLLQGKNLATYSPNIDSGDYVVVVNAAYLVVTGKKLKDKVYTRYSGYPGGLTSKVLGDVMKQKPTDVVRLAVSGMLPKNKLRDVRMGRLYVYKDNSHPHEDKFKN